MNKKNNKKPFSFIFLYSVWFAILVCIAFLFLIAGRDTDLKDVAISVLGWYGYLSVFSSIFIGIPIYIFKKITKKEAVFSRYVMAVLLSLLILFLYVGLEKTFKNKHPKFNDIENDTGYGFR